MNTLTLEQRLLLIKFFTDALAQLRTKTLVPEAQAAWEPGARIPVKFGGQLAGWVSLPKPSKTVAVTSEAQLLAWAEKNLPRVVEAVDEVAVDDDLIGFLREHYPQALRKTRRVDPQWVADVKHGLQKQGWYGTSEGEKITSLPGITVGTSDPSPRANPADDAAEVIRAARAAGLLSLDGMLALPPPMPEAGAA